LAQLLHSGSPDGREAFVVVPLAVSVCWSRRASCAPEKAEDDNEADGEYIPAPAGLTVSTASTRIPDANNAATSARRGWFAIILRGQMGEEKHVRRARASESRGSPKLTRTSSPRDANCDCRPDEKTGGQHLQRTLEEASTKRASQERLGCPSLADRRRRGRNEPSGAVKQAKNRTERKSFPTSFRNFFFRRR
jgi:hypothetical protein